MNENDSDNIKVEEPETERKENEEECNIKRRTKEDRPRRKDDKKSVEQHLKILSHISSSEEKLEMMYKMYSQVIDENRRLSLALKHSEKKVELLLREREQLQVERSKSIMTRKRLENLCRELQKQNKIVKNESLQRVKEQEEIRKDLSEKFQGGLAQITTLMNQNIEKNAKMYEENLEINKKFKAVYEQVEQKEQQLLKVHQQMKLDLQVADAKLAKVKMEATAEKEALLKEKQQLLFKMSEYQTQIKELQSTEVGLRNEISMYTDKYDEFQNALNRSNKIYTEFNMEMEKMTKKMHVLEKETSLWKQRWANSHDALLAMAADKQVRDGEIATLSKKVALLQDLCKMFQSERAKLLAQLKTQDDKTPSPESLVACAESQEIIIGKRSDELPSLENTIEQLQVSLTEVSEGMQKNLSVSPQIVNDIAVANQTSEAAKIKESAERFFAEEDTSEDASDRDHSLTKSTPTRPVFHLDSIVLNNGTETQTVGNDNEESIDASRLTVSEIFDEKLDKPLELSSNPEEVNEDKLTELLIEEISEETSKITDLSKDTETGDKLIVIDEQVETDNETEFKKRNQAIEKSLELQLKLGVKIANLEIPGYELLQAIDLVEKEELNSLRSNTNNCVNDEIESRDLKIGDSRIYEEDAINGAVDKNESAEIAHTNSNVICTLSKENCLTRDDPAAIVEKSTETIVETKAETIAETKAEIANCEPATESVNVLVQNIPEISKTTDTAATKTANLLIIDDKSEVAAATANKVVKNSSEVIDNTIDVYPIKDVPSVDEEGATAAELAAELPSAIRAPLTKNVTLPLREIQAETSLTSDNIEEKRKPIKNGKRRKK